ncbi:hypothetical protein DFH06DRAFT_1144906 [Mycena polygramma]|nr:hypothetical protein DFH06DRAFT_1144906 [Mycena polygramma]
MRKERGTSHDMMTMCHPHHGPGRRQSPAALPAFNSLSTLFVDRFVLSPTEMKRQAVVYCGDGEVAVANSRAQSRWDAKYEPIGSTLNLSEPGKANGVGGWVKDSLVWMIESKAGLSMVGLQVCVGSRRHAAPVTPLSQDSVLTPASSVSTSILFSEMKRQAVVYCGDGEVAVANSRAQSRWDAKYEPKMSNADEASQRLTQKEWKRMDIQVRMNAA